MAYDSSLPQNGVNMNVGAPLSVPYTRFGAQPVGSYAMPGSQWVPGYMMAQPVAQVDDQVNEFKRAHGASNQVLFTHQIHRILSVHANGPTPWRESSIQTGIGITSSTTWCFDDHEQ